MRTDFRRSGESRTDVASVGVEGARVSLRRNEADRTVDRSWYLASEAEAQRRGAELEAELLRDGYALAEAAAPAEAAPRPPVELVPKRRRAAFIKSKVLQWYQEFVVDAYDDVPKDQDPMSVCLNDFDGWNEGFHDDLSRAFGSSALDGSSEFLEPTIGDIVELMSRQWDGKFHGF